MSLLPTRVLLLATLAGVCCAHVALAAESKPARADLTAAQILEKHIAARGGLQAWHAVKAMSWSGKMDAGTGDSAARSSGYVRNSVAPANKKQLVQLYDPDLAKKVLSLTPMGRGGQVQECVGAVLWLCSASATFTSGITVSIDGGWSQH